MCVGPFLDSLLFLANIGLCLFEYDTVAITTALGFVLVSLCALHFYINLGICVYTSTCIGFGDYIYPI